MSHVILAESMFAEKTLHEHNNMQAQVLSQFMCPIIVFVCDNARAVNPDKGLSSSPFHVIFMN